MTDHPMSSFKVDSERVRGLEDELRELNDKKALDDAEMTNDGGDTHRPK